MNNRFYVPPIVVEPDPLPLPDVCAFKSAPAHSVKIDDLVLLGGQMWRVKEVRPSKYEPRIKFSLYPTMGGNPATEIFFRREWLPVFRATR